MRLTEKIKRWDSTLNTTYDDYSFPDHSRTNEAIVKMGKLEDLEENLGIELLTLYEISKNGIYYYSNGSIYNCIPYIDLANKTLFHFWDYCDMGHFDRGYMEFRFEDYGKKENGGWALTQEELL